VAQNDFDRVERALRHQTFGPLSTLSVHGRPHATGVVYAVSPRGEPLILYVTTRTTTLKVRNIRAHPDVAFVVPVPRRFIPGFPPRAVQFQGTATVVPGEDRRRLHAFRSSWFLHRILVAEQRIVTQGGDLCFIRIRPDSTLFTYGIGMSLWHNVRQPREAMGRVKFRNDRLP
jgi:Pyridoxamine 5'-phosphate oxidase